MSAKAIRQRGNLILPVALIGLVMTLALSAYMNHALFLEQVAVENRLAEIRSYWAAMGHFRYALSRTRYARLCPDEDDCDFDDEYDDAAKAAALQSYLNEISAYRNWTYPDESAAYWINIELTAAPDDNPARDSKSGHLMVTSSYPTGSESALPILSGLPRRFAPFELRFCAGLPQANPVCGPIGNDNGGNLTRYYSVKRLHRLKAGS
jgi:hypothetical protein